MCTWNTSDDDLSMARLSVRQWTLASVVAGPERTVPVRCDSRRTAPSFESPNQCVLGIHLTTICRWLDFRYASGPWQVWLRGLSVLCPSGAIRGERHRPLKVQTNVYLEYI